MNRSAVITRETTETTVQISLTIEGSGTFTCDTAIGFFDHMLEQFAKHGCFDLKIRGKGDRHVDFHHTVEDVGITLGRAFSHALADRAGIRRYGSVTVPMDDALVLFAADLSGRSYLNFDAVLPCQKVGNFDTELVREFFEGFARSCGATIHIKLLNGTNTHHIIEAIFKAFGRVIREAAAIDPAMGRNVPSSKGTLL